MPRYAVYIPFNYSYGGESVDEEFDTIVTAENE